MEATKNNFQFKYVLCGESYEAISLMGLCSVVDMENFWFGQDKFGVFKSSKPREDITIVAVWQALKLLKGESTETFNDTILKQQITDALFENGCSINKPGIEAVYRLFQLKVSRQ